MFAAFARVRDWLRGGDPPGRGGDSQARAKQDQAKLEQSRGLKIIEADPRRQEILEEIKGLLIRIPEDDRAELIDDTAVRFASYVGDLPASERKHHSGAFGLLDHSLDVALRAVRELARPRFRPSEDPVANHREHPIWAYSGFVLGLLHDVGKLLDLEVFAKEGSTAWDPLTEPLTSYLARQGLSTSGPGTWRWRVGRGFNGHVRQTPALVPLILLSSTVQFLGKRLPPLLEAFERSYETGREDWGSGPAARVAWAVRRGDHEDAHEGSAPKRPEKAPECPLVEPAGGEASEEVIDDAEGENVVPGALPERVETLELPFPVESLSPSLPGFGLGINAHMKNVPGTAPQLATSGQKRRAPRDREPGPKPTRGSEVESLLPPERLLESIRSWLRSGNMSRNSGTASVLVRQDYVWLRYPEAFINLLKGKNIGWSPQVGEKLDSWLLRLPQVAPENPRTALVHALSGARGAKTGIFVRFHARGFLPEKELATLGYWPHEMTIQPTAFFRDRERPVRTAERRGA